MDKFVGKRLDGRYEIQEIIGVGGMAVVYKARDNVEDRIVAIKILKDEFTSNEEFVRRFKNESKAIAMLSHPNIVKVYDVSFGDLIQYIVMEYIDGITLKEFIERQGSLRWKDAVHFTLQILKGLQHAHDKGIVHRDVKPQNIIVLPDGTIKVTDFGIARFARSEQRTITDKAIGSVHYISPEQARGERTDEKADIYSVGVILYEMITGQVPFQAESAVSVAIMQLQRDPKLPTEINGSIPQGLEQITLHAMQKSAERRYQTASEMLCDLDAFRKEPSKTFEYSYFVDDSPTKYVGAVNVRSSTPASQVVAEEPESENEVKEKSSIIPILAGIAVTLVAALIILAVIFIPKLISPTSSEIACPDFSGMSVEEVKDEYGDTFNIRFIEENNEAEKGTVFKQNQTEGKKLKKKANITLYVSLGQELVQVPDLTDTEILNAKNTLEKAGFKVKIVEKSDDDIDEGRVISTDPIKTTNVYRGSEIIVYVSTGKEVKYVTVPRAVSKDEESIKELMDEAGLVVRFEEKNMTHTDKFYSEGYAYAQEPAAGEKIAEGSEVIVYISTGVVQYHFDVEDIKLPSDFKHKTPTVSLYIDGIQVAESEKIDLAKKDSVSFTGLTVERKGSSSNKNTSVEIYVKLSGYEKDVMKLTVDMTTGKITSSETIKGYPTDKAE